MFVAMSSTTSTYKMNVKLKEKGFQHLLFSMACYHIDEKTYLHVDANNQKPIQLKGETCPLDINHNESYLWLELWLLWQPMKWSYLWNQIYLNQVSNDDINQCPNTIHQNHNVDLLIKRMKGKRQKNVGLCM